MIDMNDTQLAVAACPHFKPMEPAHQANPYPTYAALRSETPVFYDPQYDLWVVTRYADIAAAVKQSDVFSSAGAIQGNAEYSPAVQAVLDQGVSSAALMVESDGNAHSRIRGVLNKAFTPQRISKLEPQIRALTNELIDAFIADGRADLTKQFSQPLPGLVICDLLGVPRSDLPQLKRWSDDWIILLSVDVPEQQQIAFAHSIVAFQAYLRERLLERQQNPREDLLTVMLPPELGGTSALSLDEAIYNSMSVMVAGHETTTNLIANALTVLFNHPEQLQRLRENPALIPHAVEELLRFDTSVQGLFRITTRETELGGVTIPANARVFLAYGSANHDDARFPEPERFDITRPNAREHMTFSRGVHVCIGGALARLEIRIALELLLERLPNLRPDPTAAPSRMEHFWLRGYTSLPLTWDQV